MSDAEKLIEPIEPQQPVETLDQLAQFDQEPKVSVGLVKSLGIAAAVGAGIYAAERFGLTVDDKFIPSAEAKPSELFVQLHDALGTAAVVAAPALVFNQVRRNISSHFSQRHAARKQLATTEYTDNSGRSVNATFMHKLRTRYAHAVQGTLAPFLAASAVASLHATADEVSTGQVRTLEAVPGLIGLDSSKPTYLIANTDRASLADNSALNKDAVDAAVAAAPYDVTMVPIRQEWHEITVPKANGGKEHVQGLTYGLPAEIVNLPEANDDCGDVEVAVDKVLDVSLGDEIIVDGLPVKVAAFMEHTAGMNLVPVAFTDADHARCLQSSEDAPYTVALAQGDPDAIRDLLAEHGLSEDSLTSRASVFNFDEYLDNSKRIGDNSGKPLILQVITEFGVFVFFALSNDQKHRQEKNKKIIAQMRAQDVSEREIVAVESYRAGNKSLKGALLGGIGATALAYVTNAGVVGMEMGTSFKDVAVGVTVVMGAAEIGARRRTKRELKRMKLAEEMK